MGRPNYNPPPSLLRTAANKRQHGGDHYKNGGTEHWDLVERYGIGYLEGCATKYVARWRKKGGVEDLEKALHYVDKLMELHQHQGRMPRGIVPLSALGAFFKDQGISNVFEKAVIQGLCRWETIHHLADTRDTLNQLLEYARRANNADT